MIKTLNEARVWTVVPGVQVRVITYEPRTGWSSELPRELDGPRTLVLVFFAPRYIDEPAALRAVAEAFPSSIVSGCSTAGEIVGDRVFDDSIVVSVVRFDSVTLSPARVAVGDADSFAAGRELARQLDSSDLRAVFVLSRGTQINGTGLVRGLRESLPQQVTIAGGMAGDGERFGRTAVFDGAAGLLREHALAIGLSGAALRVGCGSKGGWDVFGLDRRITRSEGNLVLELDGRPALDLYRQYLGDRAAGLPAAALLFPLAIRADRDQRRLVRSVLGIDEERRALRFAAEMPPGWLAQMMRANLDRLVLGASDAAAEAAIGAAGAASLSVAISCVGRRIVLGQRTDEEVEATLEALPPGSVQVGFYSYGEIGPHGLGRSEFHNQTMTFTTLAEA
ncbi:MAG: FIST C-terminal domain-containing protein [Deltaproteobacteria bacterium]|nr:FIST C-terminal domain-containing protein [Deltaproteobacteria bacterium]